MEAARKKEDYRASLTFNAFALTRPHHPVAYMGMLGGDPFQDIKAILCLFQLLALRSGTRLAA